jgi:hypothetical protein
MEGKMQAEPEARPRRKRTAKSVAPIPEEVSRLEAEAAVPAQGVSPASAGSKAGKSAGGPAPAAPAQAGWPDRAGEPGE